MKRGSNPHLGEMVWFRLDRPSYTLWRRLKRRSGRCGLDVVRTALRHRLTYPTLYGPGAGPAADDAFVRLRLSHAARLEISERAWQAEESRSRWLGATVRDFLRHIDFARTVRVLAEGIDLRERLLETAR